MSLLCLFTKIAKSVLLGCRKWHPELKIDKKQYLQGLLSLLVLHSLSLRVHNMVSFPCRCITWSPFPAGASYGLFSLWVHHMVSFSCRCITWSPFPVGASYGLLSLRVHHMVSFPCRCITWSPFPAGASYGLLSLLVLHRFPTSKFCYDDQTKWSPLMDISQAMTPSLPQAIFLSYARLQ